MGKGSTLREGFKRDFFAESASHKGSEILLFHQRGGRVIGRDFVESVLSKVGGSGASSSVPPKASSSGSSSGPSQPVITTSSVAVPIAKSRGPVVTASVASVPKADS